MILFNFILSFNFYRRGLFSFLGWTILYSLENDYKVYFKKYPLYINSDSPHIHTHTHTHTHIYIYTYIYIYIYIERERERARMRDEQIKMAVDN